MAGEEWPGLEEGSGKMWHSGSRRRRDGPTELNAPGRLSEAWLRSCTDLACVEVTDHQDKYDSNGSVAGDHLTGVAYEKLGGRVGERRVTALSATGLGPLSGIHRQHSCAGFADSSRNSSTTCWLQPLSLDRAQSVNTPMAPGELGSAATCPGPTPPPGKRGSAWGPWYS